MGDRRDFLKAASLLPLTMVESVAEQKGMAALASSDPPDKIGLPKNPPQEQAFQNYHLMGSPDQSANLLGPSRPQNWRSTKEHLTKALSECAQPDDPIHEWLKTFRMTFDERATGIVLDARATVYKNGNGGELTYEPQLYDGLLRSAAALLDRCLRYRVEMGGFEVAGVNSGISYLAFLKLRPLQRNFLIQSSSADVADIERAAQAAASVRYRAAGGLDKLFDKYHLQGLELESQGEAEEAGLSSAKDRLRTRLLEKQFHIQVDAQLAQFTRLLSSGSASNFAERYLRLLGLVIEDLADSYRKLFSASKGIQQVLNLTKVTVGNGSPINVDIPLFNDADGVKKWVKQVVPPQEGNQREPDVLDAMVLWTRAVMRELDRMGQYETEFTVTIPLNQPWGKKNAVIVPPGDIQAAFNPTTGDPTGTVTFALTEDALPLGTAPKNIRMLGIGLSVEHSADDASPAQYSSAFPPRPAAGQNPDPMPGQVTAVQAFEAIKMARLNATIATPKQTAPTVGTYSRPALYLSNVRLQGGSGGDAEPALSYDPGCRNASPFGSWTISIDRNALAFFQSSSRVSDTWVTGLILHLRLRGSAV